MKMKLGFFFFFKKILSEQNCLPAPSTPLTSWCLTGYSHPVLLGSAGSHHTLQQSNLPAIIKIPNNVYTFASVILHLSNQFMKTMQGGAGYTHVNSCVCVSSVYVNLHVWENSCNFYLHIHISWIR